MEKIQSKSHTPERVCIKVTNFKLFISTGKTLCELVINILLLLVNSGIYIYKKP